MERSERIIIEIDDVIQVSEIPIPIQIADGDIRALCPFCGECRGLVSMPSDPANIPKSYVRLIQDTSGAFEEHFKKCAEPKVNFILKLVKIVYSFEGIRDTFDELDIQLTAKTISGADDSLRMS